MARGGGVERRREMTVNGYGISFWGNKNVLNPTVLCLHNSVNILRTTELEVLKA